MIQQITAPIVGARFRPPAADVLNNLPGGVELICVREPANEYDPNAIKVMIPISLVVVEEFLEASQEPSDVFSIDEDDRYHLGYIPKDIAVVLAPFIDAMKGTAPGKLCFNLEGRPCVEMSIEDDTA